MLKTVFNPMRSVLLIFFLPALTVLINGCTTIEIKEKDAFDAHRTITPAEFDIPGYRLYQHTIETEDGEELDSWFIQHEDAQANVIFMGGNGFLMVKSRYLIETYSSLPVNLLLFDYRGYGMSSGEPSIAGIKKDAQAAYNFVDQHEEAGKLPVYIHGHSMGSLLAGWLAGRESVDGYVLESPISSTDDWTSGLVPRLFRPLVRFDVAESIREHDNLDRVARISHPLLLIGSENDPITPFRMAESLYDASVSEQKKLINISNGGHNDLPQFSEYRDALEAFYLEHAGLEQPEYTAEY
ncbi:alpha/beta hydrolase [Natronogracilivirgula saccharolytica]|uniref:Alpha/beta hydrolase n=2 Tax=Natronogracilivirga saccharolytica TaxID=2812953 RepID=A0A8J7RQT6_9BACT|nr:alpha/beta hydrolase [Natronogracilivirga saccharolytica]